MEYYAEFVVKHRKIIVTGFLLATLICVVMLVGVKVNYNLTDYLPPSAQSTTALQILEEEYPQTIPNANVMVRDVSISQALSYKDKLEAIRGVQEVLWLDDMADLKRPLETLDPDTVEGFYKNQNALFSVTISKGMEADTVQEIRNLLGERGAVSGEAADTSTQQNSASSETMLAMIIVVPAIILILILSTPSWLEPLLFLSAIGISIALNMGTNLFFGQISFLTNSVSPILQLAVSLDYAIFLLNSFAVNLMEDPRPEVAMKRAMKKSVRAVAASAVTTLFGFLALAFMEFGIGADLGLILAKGIVLSFICCMVFLPAVTLLCYRAILKTNHVPFLPDFHNINRVFSKLAMPALVVVILLAIPAFLGQRSVEFCYLAEDTNASSQTWQESQAIRSEFGESNAMVLLVPKGDVVKEYELAQELLQMDHVTSVTSYATQVGMGIPAEFLDPAITQQFYSDHYARLILYTDTKSEGTAAFRVVEQINDTARSYYGDTFYSTGQSANLYDMRNVTQTDNVRVTLIAVVAIFFVLLVTFKSALLPLVLLFTIEIGIWINLSIPYFMGMPLNFLGYLIVNTVQLGATVDYAILLTSYYLDNRKQMGQKAAISKAMGETFKSILVSGATLSVAGVTLSFASSNSIVSGFGLLLARGTILSMLMVLCLLPALLRILDRPIGLVTYRAGFYQEERRLTGRPDKGEHT